MEQWGLEKCKSLALTLMTWYSKLVGNSDRVGDAAAAAAAEIKIEMESHFHLLSPLKVNTPSGKYIGWKCVLGACQLR